MITNEKKILIKCFICKRDILEGEQTINKTLNKSWVRNVFTSSWNDTTNYENMIICENCTFNEINAEVKNNEYNYQTALMIFTFFFCYIFWLEVFKELPYESKLKWSSLITFFSVIIYIYIVNGDSDKHAQQ